MTFRRGDAGHLCTGFGLIMRDALLRSRAGGRASRGRAASPVRFSLPRLAPDTQLAKSAATATCSSLSYRRSRIGFLASGENAARREIDDGSVRVAKAAKPLLKKSRITENFSDAAGNRRGTRRGFLTVHWAALPGNTCP